MLLGLSPAKCLLEYCCGTVDCIVAKLKSQSRNHRLLRGLHSTMNYLQTLLVTWYVSCLMLLTLKICQKLSGQQQEVP